MRKPAQVARDDVSSKYESRIQKLVEEDRVGAARKLVDDALRENPLGRNAAQLEKGFGPRTRLWQKTRQPRRYCRTPVVHFARRTVPRTVGCCYG